ncbi:MAG: hypothetical protein JWP75_3857 [Frondihabitans sp.]|nr:hypothetical protein [Frondihabitans sp.]
MTSSLPPLLTSADLPWPELQAAALDGDVYRLDRAFCSIAEFDVPWRRAAAVAPVFGDEFVVARTSAAWVWGAIITAPTTHEGYRAVCLRDDAREAPLASGADPVVPIRRWRDSPVGMHVSEVVLDDCDVVDFGAVRVTSPVRTVVDLVRADAWGSDIAAAVRGLCAEHRVDRAACDTVLDRRRNLPHKRRARGRLEAILSMTQPVSAGSRR